MPDLPNYEEDAPTLADLSTDKVAQIGKLAEEVQAREGKIIFMETALEQEEQALNKVQGGILPELLESFGITDVTLKDGSKLNVKRLYAAHISEARKTEAHKWMEDHGFGSLIKKTVTVAIEDEKRDLEDLTGLLHENGFRFEIDSSIHFKTLETFVKGQLESTEDGAAKPPLDLFGIFVAKKAIITNKQNKAPKRKYKKK